MGVSCLAWPRVPKFLDLIVFERWSNLNVVFSEDFQIILWYSEHFFNGRFHKKITLFFLRPPECFKDTELINMF